MPKQNPPVDRIVFGLDPAEARMLSRLGEAFAHPLRVQIIQCVSQGRASANSVATLLQIELEEASYHLNEVLDRRLGIVKKVEERTTRGWDEKLYELDLPALKQLAPKGLARPLRSLLCSVDA
jgi:Helix-turn-helix domain